MRATSEFINGNSQATVRANATSRRDRKELSQLWQGFVAFFAGNSDPKIQRISEDSWRVYDPRSNRSLSFNSEQEVRVWLDERYSF